MGERGQPEAVPALLSFLLGSAQERAFHIPTASTTAAISKTQKNRLRSVKYVPGLKCKVRPRLYTFFPCSLFPTTCGREQGGGDRTGGGAGGSNHRKSTPSC